LQEAVIKNAWNGPPQCEHCGIRHLVLFSALRGEDFSLIHEPIEEITFKRGQRIYHAGDDPEYLYTVREGVVKLEHSMADGSERIVRILMRGSVAGLEALVGQSYKQDAVVIDPVLTCRIPIRTIHHLNRDLPHFHRQLLSRWQEALTAADAWLTELGTGTARMRIARLLLHFSEQQSPGEAFFVPTREDMAAMVSTSTETASRITAEFYRKGLLENVTRN
jgi:CRP-like cAMP-binding protein